MKINTNTLQIMIYTIVKKDLTFQEAMHYYRRNGLVGEIPAYPIAKLTKLFGQPARFVCDKSEREWTVCLMKGSVIIGYYKIYDYYGERWHVGGDEGGKKHFDRFVKTLTEMIGA